jgi:hypothetical protein
MKFGFMKHVLMNETTDGSTGGSGGSGDGGTGGQSASAGTGTGGTDGQSTGGNDLNALPEWAKTEIANLRKESAKHRTTNNELKSRLDKFETNLKKVLGDEDEDQTPPEEKLTKVTAQAEALAIHNALLELAVENGIPKDQFKYFSFLMNEKLSGLEEDQELTEDDLAEIMGQLQPVNNKPAQTSFGAGGKKNEGGTSDTVTLEAFNKMTIMQKSALYQKDKATYDRLMAESKGTK